MKHSLTTKLAKGLPALIAGVVLSHSPVASAGPAIGLDPNGGGSYTTYADLWTNNTDSALSIGFNPATLIPGGAPYDIQLLAQASVTTMKNGATNVKPAGLDPASSFTSAICTAVGGCFQITKVLNIQEKVVSNNGTSAIFGDATQTADVDAGTAGNQQLAIYIQPLTSGTDPTRAIPGDGAGTVSGYTSGTLILSAHVVSNVSSFAASGSIGTGSFDLRFLIDYADANYLDIATGSILGDKLTGTTNVPSQFNPAVMWDGTTTAGLGKILLKVDSSESFAVPEPGSLALLGLGLLGLGATVTARRRRTMPMGLAA